jgi:hypothetical protein
MTASGVHEGRDRRDWRRVQGQAEADAGSSFSRHLASSGLAPVASDG